MIISTLAMKSTVNVKAKGISKIIIILIIGLKESKFWVRVLQLLFHLMTYFPIYICSKMTKIFLIFRIETCFIFRLFSWDNLMFGDIWRIPRPFHHSHIPFHCWAPSFLLLLKSREGLMLNVFLWWVIAFIWRSPILILIE